MSAEELIENAALLISGMVVGVVDAIADDHTGLERKQILTAVLSLTASAAERVIERSDHLV